MEIEGIEIEVKDCPDNPAFVICCYKDQEIRIKRINFYDPAYAKMIAGRLKTKADGVQTETGQKA